MTPDRDLEQRLASFLAEGPIVPPPASVAAGLERARGSSQRRGPAVWLERTFGPRFAGPRRSLALATAGAAIIVAAIVTSTSLAPPRPLPALDPDAVLAVQGSAATTRSHEDAALRIVELDLRMEDPRAGGVGRAVLHSEIAPDGVGRISGLIRIRNQDGTWTGSVRGVRDQAGAEWLVGWLDGLGAYAGFSLFLEMAGAEGSEPSTVRAVIWPGAPPSIPGPELLAP